LHAQKKKEKILVGEDGKKYAISKKNRSVYISGLPKDIRESECYEFFSKVAIIERDADTGDFKIKIYRDPATGEPKGDGLVTFLRPEAVALAILRLDETEIRTGFPLKLTEAKYELKEGHHPVNKAAKSKKMASKRKVFDQSAELGWDERENRHVIIKHMFDAKSDEARLDVNFYDDLKSELIKELESQIGGYESIKIFERSPEGVVAAKFSSQLEAEKCIKLMDGRFFGGQKLHCFFYDGFTDYAVAEPDEDKEARDQEWAKFLGAQEEPVGPPSPKRAKLAESEATPPASPKADEDSMKKT
jgi:HIV Tat-specific factor 1